MLTRVDTEFVMAAADVLHERMITRAERSPLSPRIGQSLALSRPWSHSTRLFAYRVVVDLETALAEQFFDIAMGEPVPQIPAHGEDDDLGREPAPDEC